MLLRDKTFFDNEDFSVGYMQPHRGNWYSRVVIDGKLITMSLGDLFENGLRLDDFKELVFSIVFESSTTNSREFVRFIGRNIK